MIESERPESGASAQQRALCWHSKLKAPAVDSGLDGAEAGRRTTWADSVSVTVRCEGPGSSMVQLWEFSSWDEVWTRGPYLVVSAGDSSRSLVSSIGVDAIAVELVPSFDSAPDEDGRVKKLKSAPISAWARLHRNNAR